MSRSAIAARPCTDESTVCRVTRGKFAQTPQGVFELKHFFSASIGSGDGSQAFAGEAVKEKVRRVIHQEEPSRPLSDEKIAAILAVENVKVSRRTVAKYRKVLKIPPAHRRKRV